ncbi:MAG: hypothetical protein ACQEVA_12375 [Myxococcota bacterium]
MPDTDKDAGAGSITAPARVLKRVRRKSWWAPLLAPFQTLVALAPSHKSTKKGRRNAAQLRIVLVAVGVLGLAFGGETLYIILGGLIMALGLVIPMSEVRKRTLMGKFKRLRGESPRDTKISGEVEFDGKRLILRAEDEKLRRILVDRAEHSVRETSFDGHACLEIRPKSGGKSRRIWICNRDSSPATQGDTLGRGDVDAPAFVSSADYRRLSEALENL